MCSSDLRMKQADPAEIRLRECGKILVNPIVHICFETPSPEWNRLVQSGDLKAILKYLIRGWKFQPGQGDHDRGPDSIKTSN